MTFAAFQASTLLAALPHPSLSHGHVKAKNETVPRRCGAPGWTAPSREQRPGPSPGPPLDGAPRPRRGDASADGPADGPGCCAPDAAPGTARRARRGLVRRRATKYKWTVDEMNAIINLIKSTDFKVEDVNVDLHKRVAAAIAKGHFTSHNMRQSDLDVD